MALYDYIDPYQDPDQDPGRDPTQDPGRNPADRQPPLIDPGPPFRAVNPPMETGGDSSDSFRGGGVPFGPAFSVLNWLFHFNPFHHNAPTNPTPGVVRTPIERTPVGPAAPAPPAKTPSTTQKAITTAADLAPLIPLFRAMFSNSNSNANNPANAALTALLPQLTSNLTSLLNNDLQRRQMSDPLYQAVLQGAMGGLPVWMRAGVNPITAAAVTTPALPPSGGRTTPPGVPSSGTAVPRV